jgi:hypothetical protein
MKNRIKIVAMMAILLGLLVINSHADHYIAGDSISSGIFKNAKLSLQDSSHLRFLGEWGQETTKTISLLKGGLFREGDNVTLVTGTASILHGIKTVAVIASLDEFIPEFLKANPYVTLNLSLLPPVKIPWSQLKIKQFNKLIKKIADKYNLKLNDYGIKTTDLLIDNIHLKQGVYDGRHFKN